jgi:serine/threonine protein phosphatase PrpC
LTELSEQLRKESQGAPGLAGIGSTVVLALLHAGHAIVSHLGDSRAYLLHAGRLKQLTNDHTIAQLLADRGEIRPAEVASHPSRSQLTRFVGMSTEAMPDTECVELTPGDRLLLCTDGLSGMLSDQQILNILNEQPSPDAACQRLIDAANEAGGTDNVTAVIVDIGNAAAG